MLVQNLLPRMMLENIPRETFIQQIPYLCTQFTVRSDEMVAKQCRNLDVSLSPLEIKAFERHLLQIFRDDGKTYPNIRGETEADQVRRVVAHLYRVIDNPAVPSISTQESSGPKVASTTVTSDLRASTPVSVPITSVAKKIHPEKTEAVTADSPAATSSPASLEAKKKPDLAAMRAAALAKAEGKSLSVTPVETNTAAPQPTAISPTPNAKPKPDLAAMRAAAKAKLEAQTTPTSTEADIGPQTPDTSLVNIEPSPIRPTTTSTNSSATVSAKPKPDLAAMRAAAKAKLEAQSTSPSAETTISPQRPDAAQVNIETGPILSTANTTNSSAAGSAKPKPDLAAMRAAALAKAAQKQVTGSGPASAAEPAATDKTATNQNPLVGQIAPVKSVAPPKLSTSNLATSVPLNSAKNTVTPRNAAPLASPAKVKPSEFQLADFKKFYQEMIRPYLLYKSRVNAAWHQGISRASLASRVRQTGEHPDLAPILKELQDFCEQRQQFELVRRYHAWLHGWLMIHIPTTVALYCILLVHIVMALRVVPFSNSAGP